MSEITRHDIIKIFRERQDKFVYYLMGLNVAALGFTLSKTYEMKHFSLNDSFLAFALIGWLLSLINAFRWIQMQFNGMRLDMHEYDISAGVVETWFEDGAPPEGYKEALFAKLQEEKSAKAETAEKDYKRMLLLFLGGIVMFILWRVLEILDLLK